MKPSQALPAVVDRPKESRFVAEVEGLEAELTYVLDGERFTLVHTGTPVPLRGQGIGTALVCAAIDRALAEHLTVVPTCPFAHAWLLAHPDVAARLTIDWDATQA